jgi:hypothetical protein
MASRNPHLKTRFDQNALIHGHKSFLLLRSGERQQSGQDSGDKINVMWQRGKSNRFPILL